MPAANPEALPGPLPRSAGLPGSPAFQDTGWSRTRSSTRSPQKREFHCFPLPLRCFPECLPCCLLILHIVRGNPENYQPNYQPSPLQRYVVMHEWAHNLKTITMGFPVSP